MGTWPPGSVRPQLTSEGQAEPFSLQHAEARAAGGAGGVVSPLVGVGVGVSSMTESFNAKQPAGQGAGGRDQTLGKFWKPQLRATQGSFPAARPSLARSLRPEVLLAVSDACRGHSLSLGPGLALEHKRSRPLSQSYKMQSVPAAEADVGSPCPAGPISRRSLAVGLAGTRSYVCPSCAWLGAGPSSSSSSPRPPGPASSSHGGHKPPLSLFAQ